MISYPVSDPARRRPRLVVFVLSYRSRADLEAGTLDSIVRAASRVHCLDVRLVFLDNYSGDGSIEWVTAHYSDTVDVLMAPRNYLYCKGTNVGLQFAQARYQPDYFILVDADNRAEPDAYAELVDFAAANPAFGLVQPLVLDPRDPTVIYSCGHRFLEDGQCRSLDRLPEDRSALLDLPSCSLSSTLVRTRVLAECGLLDEIYEMYFESSDLSFRARRGGYRCACHPAAVTYNAGTTGAGLKRFHNRYYFNRNRLIFWRIHDPEFYTAVRERQLGIYRDLQREFEASRFGLDAEREAVRRGIEAGLALADGPRLLPRPTVRLDGFDKAAAVVIQLSRDCSLV